MGIKNKQELNPNQYSMLGKIPWNYPTKSMRGIKIYDYPEHTDEKYGLIRSGEDLWASIEATMATVPEKQYKPVTQRSIDDFIANAKEKLKTVDNPITRESIRQLGLAMVARMKRELKP